jgi:predicted transcriptional regulator of viral defense system
MPPAGPKTRLYGTQPDRAPAGAQRAPSGGSLRERAIQELAARQHGVISLSQLKSLGLGASGVRRRVATGKLRRLHRGVYAIGLARRSIEATYMAAVLACGPKAALAHRSAGAHLGLRPCNRPRVDVIAPGRTGKGRQGIDVHQIGRAHV